MSARPLVTFALFAYEHERFAVEAVRGALTQTYSPLEILIWDDCSTDSTFEIIQREIAAYSGPHTVTLHRNHVNLGFGASLNRVVGRATSRLIVVASADDISLPDRVEHLYESYAASNGKALSLFSNALAIDEDGNHQGWCNPSTEVVSRSLSHIAKRMAGVLGSTHAFDKRVFEVFGPIIESKIVLEDLMIPFRSALLGEVRYIEKPLVLYRFHADNANSKKPSAVKAHELEMDLLKSADRWIDVCTQRLKDIKTAMKLFPERRAELLNIQTYSLTCLREKEDHKLLLSTPNTFQRLLIMGRALRDGVRLRVLIRWTLTFFFPSLYLLYQRNLFAKARKKPLTEGP